jgi:hypothetical protein
MMTSRKSGALLGCLFAIASLAPSAAEIFKQELPDGSVIYSDQPPTPNAKALELPPPQVIDSYTPPPASQRSTNSKQANQQAIAAYEEIAITSPTQDEAIWNNENLLDVTVSLRPPLRSRAGHNLVILMDGQAVARSQGEILFHLNDVFRGTHVLEAMIADNDGKELQRSAPITIHVHQASIQAPNRRPVAPPPPQSPRS